MHIQASVVNTPNFKTSVSKFTDLVFKTLINASAIVTSNTKAMGFNIPFLNTPFLNAILLNALVGKFRNLIVNASIAKFTDAIVRLPVVKVPVARTPNA